MVNKMITAAATGTLAALLATGASAVTYLNTGINGGNICQGSLADCSVTIDVGDGETLTTPAIAKFEVDGGMFSLDGTSSLFPSVTGSEFMISLTDANTASFSYMVGANDPALTAIAVKGGSDQNVDGKSIALYNFFDGDFSYDAATMTYSGTFSTEGLLNNGEETPGISNVTFFDTGLPDMPTIPVPAAGWMLIAGLGGLAAARRRKA